MPTRDMNRLLRFIAAALFFLVLCAGPAFGISNGTNIADNTHPSVGIVHVDGAYGSGTLIRSTIVSATSDNWVLTAGHVVDGKTGRGFIPKGGTAGAGAKINAAKVIVHPAVAGKLADIALMELNSAISGITPSNLNRSPVAVTNVLQVVGFGAPQDLTNFPTKVQKRQGDFTVDAIELGNTRILAYTNPLDKLPTTEGGDSGAPWFEKTNFTISGVHCGGNGFGGGGGVPAGHDASGATAVLPYLDWIDFYTKRSVYWDKLEFNNMLTDDFEADANGDGLADGWSITNVTHPILGNITSTGWNDIDAKAGGLPSSGSRAQGEAMFGGSATVIKKEFTIAAETDFTIEVDQRWNSLVLSDDMGIQLGNGEIKWDGLATSSNSDLNQWFTRDFSVNSGSETHLTVYLLSAVPEPASIVLVAFGLLGLAFCGWRGKR